MKILKLLCYSPKLGRRETLCQTLKTELLNYLLLSLCLYISILFLTANFELEGFNYFSAQMRRMTDGLLLALPILFLRKKKFIIPYIFIINLYLLSIPWYYRTYGTIMPLSSYLMIDNLNGLGSSIFASMRWKDILQIAPSVLYIILYTMGAIKRCLSIWRVNLGIGLISLSYIIVITSLSYLANNSDSYASPYGLFRNEPIRAFKQLGFIHFWNIQLQSFRPVSNAEREKAIRFLRDTYPTKHTKTITGKYQTNKNLIVILVESFNSWTIQRSVNGIEITPCINQLLKDSTTIYFPNMLPQVKDGRSSDAQLLINTGLLPINSGAVSARYFSNIFPSLPKALEEKGYTSVSILCDDKAYWNQEAFSKSYGINHIYDKMGVWDIYSDEKLFSKSITILQELSQPFYAQMVTMSMHGPDYPRTNSALNQQDFSEQMVKNYCVATQYTDSCIGRFIEKLKETDLYSNSVIVITGDHNCVDFNRFEGRPTPTLSDCSIPFILLNAPARSNHQNKVVGQVDIYPTLLHCMGCQDYNWKGLGEDLFQSQISGCAVYHTGEVAGNPQNEQAEKERKEIWEISDIMIRMNYFKENNNKRKYIAHAGGKINGYTYTNCKEAVLQSINNGFHYIELDLSLTADSQLVATHDWIEFNKQTGHPEDTCALSLSEFKSRRIHGKYTPLSYHDIDSIWQANPQLYLVTDKISDADILTRFFSKLKRRMLVEAFSFEDYVALKKVGFYCPILSGSCYKSTLVNQSIKHLFDKDQTIIDCFTMDKENYERDWKFRWINKLYDCKVALFTVVNEQEGEKYFKKNKNIEWIYIN